MEKKEIIDILTNIMKENFEKVKYIKLDDNLIEGGLDSITAIKLIIKIEETFDFEFYDEDLLIENFSTLNAVIEYIYKRLNEINEERTIVENKSE